MKRRVGISWRPRLRRFARISLRLAAALFACFTYGSHAEIAHASPALDQPAPPLTVTELDGHIFDLSKMRGNVVLVNYWATWCGPCKAEMPALNAFYLRHHDEGLELIGISTDHPEDYGKMREMSRSLAYPTALYAQLSNDGFGVPEGFPLTYVIDGNGIVRDKFIGVGDQLLNDVVLPLLRGLPNAHAR
jgi:peroxiredoxin